MIYDRTVSYTVEQKGRNMKNKKAWLMWAIMIVTYMFNTFHAVSMGVLRSDIISDFSLSEGQFVLLTNIFSYAYMLMQIPVGILLDQFGAKRISCVGNMVAAVGVLLFACANHYLLLLIGRGLIGLGCSVCFLSVLKICSEWYSEQVFCTMSSLTTFVGMFGAVFAQMPLAVLSSMMSWRRIYIVIALVTICTVLLILFVVRDSPNDMRLQECNPVMRKISVIDATKSILVNKYTWAPLVVYGCFYGSYLLVTGVYGSSILATFYHCSSVQASGCISATVWGCAIGSVVIGVLSDRIRDRKRTQFVFGVFYVVSWILFLCMVGHIPLRGIYPILFLLGFNSCAYSVCWSCVKECNHPDYVGISTSIANMGGCLGSILVPSIIGALYSHNLNLNGAEGTFELVMKVAIIINIIGVIFAAIVKETRGENIYGRTDR